jgi:hypothetical protein
MRTVFFVPRLNQASVVAGACCPVPAEALIVPELEAVTGVYEAAADWQTAQVVVDHAPELDVRQLEEVLAELGYPVASTNRNTVPAAGVTTVD